MDKRDRTENDMWPITEQRLELYGIYSVDVTLSRPKAGIEWRKGVAMDHQRGRKDVKANGALDAVNMAADALAERHPRHNVTVRYCEHGREWKTTRKHTA